jgi:hypothetical protein
VYKVVLYCLPFFALAKDAQDIGHAFAKGIYDMFRGLQI